MELDRSSLPEFYRLEHSSTSSRLIRRCMYDAVRLTRTVGRDLKLKVEVYARGSNILVYKTLSIFRNLDYQIYIQRLRLYIHLLQFLRD